MTPKTLAFYAEGSGLVPDFHAQEAGVRRFVGRSIVEIEGDEKRHGWAPTHKPEVVRYHHDFVRAAKEGHLVPADEETAKACGLEFKPYVPPPDDEKKKDDDSPSSDVSEPPPLTLGLRHLSSGQPKEEA